MRIKLRPGSTNLRATPESESGNALSGSGPAGTIRVDQRKLGPDGEQSGGKVLFDHQSRRKGTQQGNPALAQDGRTRRKTAR